MTHDHNGDRYPAFAPLPDDGIVGGAMLGTKLDGLLDRFRIGDRLALLDAFEVCAMLRTIPPDWVLFEVGRAFSSYTNADARTLDLAFGVARKKNENLEGTKNRVLMTNGIRLAVQMARKATPEVAIHHDLFEEIGEAFGISASTCAAIYYGR